MKLYKDPTKAIPLMVARLIKAGILTDADANDILGEPMDSGKLEYPEAFSEWYNLYPMSGTRGNRKTGFKRQAFLLWMRMGFGEEESQSKALIKATEAYKSEYGDGNQFVKKPQNFLADNYWESWMPAGGIDPVDPGNEGAFKRW
jgi:hypothetical protein